MDQQHTHESTCGQCDDRRLMDSFTTIAQSMHSIARSVHILVCNQLDLSAEEKAAQAQKIAEMGAQLDATSDQLKASAKSLADEIARDTGATT